MGRTGFHDEPCGWPKIEISNFAKGAASAAIAFVDALKRQSLRGFVNPRVVARLDIGLLQCGVKPSATVQRGFDRIRESYNPMVLRLTSVRYSVALSLQMAIITTDRGE